MSSCSWASDIWKKKLHFNIQRCVLMGHSADIKGPLIIYDGLQNTEIEQNLLMRWELLSLRRTVCVSETEKFKYQFARCFVSGGLFKLAHAHETEFSQSCIIAPRFLSRLLWMEEQSPSWHPRCPLVNEVNMHVRSFQLTLRSLWHSGMDVSAMASVHDSRFHNASTDGSNCREEISAINIRWISHKRPA